MIEIVRVGADTAHLLDTVAEDVFDAPIDQTLLQAFVAAPGHLMVIAVEGGTVIGQARGMIHHNPDRPGELYVDNLGVAPTALRRGIGRRLMQELFAWAREHGADSAWVATEADNVAAVGLYRAIGAEAVPMAYFEYELD